MSKQQPTSPPPPQPKPVAKPERETAPNDQSDWWKWGLFGVGLIAGIVGGVMLINYAGALLRPPTTPGAALDAAYQGKSIDGNTICKSVTTDDFNGAFRELDCLVTFRRAFPNRGSSLDKIVLRKFRALHKRLRTKSNDWRTVHRWKLLYILGTRMYPVQNKWGEHADIPVYEVNGHHLAAPFWIKESQRRNIGPLFHLDTHNDMRAVPSPKDVLKAVAKLKHNRDTKNAWHTIAHAIYDCAMPVAGGVLGAGYRRVVWGKPSWNGYTEFVNRKFFFGAPKQGIPVITIPSALSAKERKKLTKAAKKAKSKRDHYRLFYDPKLDKKPMVPRAEAWIHIQPNQRPLAKKFELFTPFTLSVLTTDMPISASGANGGKAKYNQLLQALPKGRFTLDLDLDYFASIDSTEQFKRKAGSDPEWQLDLFKKRRKILKKNLKNFREMLVDLKKRGRIPAVITIADSTYLTFALDPIAEGQSEYTPIEHTAFLRRKVHLMFREIYGKAVEGRTRYNQRDGRLPPFKKRTTSSDQVTDRMLKADKKRKAAKRKVAKRTAKSSLRDAKTIRQVIRDTLQRKDDRSQIREALRRAGTRKDKRKAARAVRRPSKTPKTRAATARPNTTRKDTKRPAAARRITPRVTKGSLK